ncbi:MAG: hypothetical protein U0797_20025 [Gemmataceae bacterium]
MMQPQPQTTSLFRTSLRDWQARFKARQAAQDVPDAAPEQPTREKRLVARKRRKMKQSAGEATE